MDNKGNKEKPVKTDGKQDSRFKPGQSGNPKGRPKGSVSITDTIRQKLLECPPGEKRTYLSFLITRILNAAIKDGEPVIIKQIWAYMDGMPRQSLEATVRNVPGVALMPIEDFLKLQKKDG